MSTEPLVSSVTYPGAMFEKIWGVVQSGGISNSILPSENASVAINMIRHLLVVLTGTEFWYDGFAAAKSSMPLPGPGTADAGVGITDVIRTVRRTNAVLLSKSVYPGKW
jgi:hypothetical protein